MEIRGQREVRMQSLGDRAMRPQRLEDVGSEWDVARGTGMGVVAVAVAVAGG